MDTDIKYCMDNFTLEKRIGKGEFSEVFRAKCNLNDEIVALKKLHSYDVMDAEMKRECIREIDLLKSLRHKNVIQYYGSFEEAKSLNIILELADAGDLTKMIRFFKKQKRFIPEKTIWKYFVQITAALQHMHSRRIMHRDIKPANVFVTRSGVVKLGDLGLGRYFSSQTFAAHTALGTPYYMSPERIQTDQSGYNFKSDIWSLGCLLYEFAALKSPFYAEDMNIYSLCQKIQKCDYPGLSSCYTSDLKQLVGDCIQLKPENRPSIDYVYQIAEKMSKVTHDT